ncbi:hypothetical protein [Actinoplanes sp. NPDC049681]|uniref:hypothetical protein n=1 Tax=Actinoplanes sp. NPDC049681 TaxID=3363905 RepID=UPI003791FDC3
MGVDTAAPAPPREEAPDAYDQQAAHLDREALPGEHGIVRRAVLSREYPADPGPVAEAEFFEDPPEFTELPRRRRMDHRTRGILVAAAAAAFVVNAGAMWAYWKVTVPSEGAAAVEMNLRGRSSFDVPLQPGTTGDLTVTVTNTNDFPVSVTSLSAGTGKVIADDEHRENGCQNPGVTFTRPMFQVRWDVTRNNVAAFTVRNGLSMATDADPACRGAVFTVPVQIRGTADR